MNFPNFAKENIEMSLLAFKNERLARGQFLERSVLKFRRKTRLKFAEPLFSFSGRSRLLVRGFALFRDRYQSIFQLRDHHLGYVQKIYRPVTVLDESVPFQEAHPPARGPHPHLSDRLLAAHPGATRPASQMI